MLTALKAGPAAPIQTFARFQAGFLSSVDFHRFLSIFIDFHRFSQILLDFRGFGAWMLTALKAGPAAPI